MKRSSEAGSTLLMQASITFAVISVAFFTLMTFGGEGDVKRVLLNSASAGGCASEAGAPELIRESFDPLKAIKKCIGVEKKIKEKPKRKKHDINEFCPECGLGGPDGGGLNR